jgi:hypothetical protein
MSKVVDLLWTCCEFVVQLVVGPTAQTPFVRFVVDLLWICCKTFAV